MKSTPRDLRRYLGAILLVLIVVVTWRSPLDQRATESIDDGMEKAFTTFAAARGLNAAISLVQGTEVTVGVGLGATFSVGEVLDPVNDLVEQFADLMLLATVSFGIQKMLLFMGHQDALKWAVTVLVLAWAGLYVFGKSPPRVLTSLLIFGLMVRFAIPVATVGTDAMFNAFLKADYDSGEQVIEDTKESVEAVRLNPEVVAPQASNTTPAQDVALPKKEVVATPPVGDASPNKQGMLDTVLDALKEAFNPASQPPTKQKPGNTPAAPADKAAPTGNMASDAKSWIQDALSDWKFSDWELPNWEMPKLPNPAEKIEKLKKAVEDSVKHIVRLIVVFLFQTLIIPLAILWVLYRITCNALDSVGRGTISGRQQDTHESGGKLAGPTAGG